MTTLREIEEAIPKLNAAELVELERFVREQRRRKPVEWPNFEARRRRTPPGAPLSEIVGEAPGEY